MRIKRGSILISFGLLMMASAAGLTAYNLYDEYKAGEQAKQALEVFDFLQESGTEEEEYAFESAAPVIGKEMPQNTQLPEILTQQHPQETGNLPESNIPPQDAVTPNAIVQEETGIQPEQTIDPAATPMPLNEQAPQVTIPGMYFPEIDYDEIEIPDYILNPKMDMPVKEADGQKYIGVLEIPILNLTLPVISEWNYARLKKAPCRYVGSAYMDNLVIAAHNYKTHFGNLKKLNAGDSVIFTDAVGNRFEYEVVLTETLMPRDVKEMKSEEFDLSLFTCTVGGSYRVTVRCDRLR